MRRILMAVAALCLFGCANDSERLWKLEAKVAEQEKAIAQHERNFDRLHKEEVAKIQAEIDVTKEKIRQTEAASN